MINIKDLISYLDAQYFCHSRTCSECKATFNVVDDCAADHYSDVAMDTIKVLEKYLDRQWDEHDVMMKTTVSDEEFLSILEDSEYEYEARED